MKAEQILQDEEYHFPYHYVARLGGEGFRAHFVDTWAINYASTIEFLLDQVAQSKAASIVDIGCGDGRFTRELALALPGRRVVGIDYSERAICLAKAMNQDRAIEFRQLDITTTPSDERFEAAILMEVFEHIPPAEGETFLKGVRDLLVPGGRLFLTVPHANKPLEYKHYRHFTFESITDSLNGQFEIMKIIPFEKRSLYGSIVKKLLSNRFFILNNQRALNVIYKYYMKHLFNCKEEGECQRIYLEAVARP
jgi:SAM-dependent methyltransferase